MVFEFLVSLITTFSVVNWHTKKLARLSKVTYPVNRKDESGFPSPKTLTDSFPFILPILPKPKFGGSNAYNCLSFHSHFILYTWELIPCISIWITYKKFFQGPSPQWREKKTTKKLSKFLYPFPSENVKS